MKSDQAGRQTEFSRGGYFMGRTILSLMGVPRDVGDDCRCRLAGCSYSGSDLGIFGRL